MSQANTLIDRQSSPPPRLTHRTNRGRLTAVIVMILALIATGGIQYVARDQRAALLGTSNTQSRIGNMDSFALSLVLGGLRGPLVMALWSSSENQKTTKDLEDFDTKVELIRLLQPEFDSVHIFQIWNKAYNVSAQRINLANKYTEILDAINYARRVDRPNDINIVTAEGMIFNDKLGTSQQKGYFRNRVRSETMFRDTTKEKSVVRAEQRPTKLEPMLDKNGMLTPESLKRYPELAEFQPFPYGVSTIAIAYSLLEHARYLSVVEHQKHAQMTEVVIDSRSALAVKGWYEEELERGRLAEAEAFGEAVPSLGFDDQIRRAQLDVLGAHVSFPATLAKPQRTAEALYSYDLALRLQELATKKMKEHADRYKNMFDVYHSARDILAANADMLMADRDFLKATQNSQAAPALLKSASEHYKRASNEFRQVVLQYFVEDSAAKQVGYRREAVPSVDDTKGLIALTTQLQQLYDHLKLQGRVPFETHPDDWAEYGAAIERCNSRVAAIQKATGQ